MRIWASSKSELITFLSSYSGPLQIVTINGEMLYRASRDKYFLSLLRSPDVLCVVDGVWARLMLGYECNVWVQRLPGVELGLDLIESRPPVYLLGAKKEVIELTANKLEEKGCKIAGLHHGYFKYEQESIIIRQIANSGARSLLVAMGSPKQEYFIYKNLKKLPPLVAMGVGGSFDVWSGKVRPTPKVFSKLGLEWLYRNLRPGRFHRLLSLVGFGWWVLSSRLSGQALFGDQVE